MASVDEKVVSLEFDNKQFESAVSQTLQSLENLKNSLNFKGVGKTVASTFGQVQNSIDSVDFSKISQDLDEINNRFSTMGIVGATAIAKLTNSAMNFGKNVWNNTIGQIMSGGRRRAQNLEMANFQLEGLGFKGKKLETLNKNIKDSVFGTAYGLDEAAKVASQLAASNVKEGDAMYQSLRAVAGVAAMTGAEYSRIGDIFTTVAGNGKVMSMQLLQMSSAGLNGAAAIAKYLNSTKKGAKVTEAQVRDMVSKSKIDFELFSKAMTYNFGDQAAKANETFSGALSNMKAALSRIGADFYTPYLKNMRDVFNVLRVFIDNVHTALKPLLDGLNAFQNYVTKVFVAFAKINEETGIAEGLVPIIDAFKAIFGELGKVLNLVGKAFTSVFGSKTAKQVGATLRTLVQGFANFVNQFTGTDVFFEHVLLFFKNIFKIAQGLLSIFGPIIQKVFGLLTSAMSLFVRIFEQFVIGFLSGTSLVVKTLSNLFHAIFESSGVQKIMEMLSSIISKLADVGGELFKVFYRITTTIKWTIFRVLQAIFENLTEVLLGMTSVLPDIISGISSFIKAFLGIDETASLLDIIIEKLTQFENFLKEINSAVKEFYQNNIKNLSKSVKAWRESEEVMAIFADIGQSITDIFSSIWGILVKIASIIGNTLKSIFNGLSSGFHGFNQEVEKTEQSFNIFDVLTGILSGLRDVLKVISTIVVKFTSNLGKMVNFIKGRLIGAFDKIRTLFLNVFNVISHNTIFEDFKKSFEGFISSIYGVGSFEETGLYQALNSIKTFFSDLVSSGNIGEAVSHIKNFFKTVKDAIGERAIKIFSNLGTAASNLWTTLKTFFSELANRPEVQSFISMVKEGIGNALEFLANSFSNGMDAVADFIDSLRGMDSISFSNILNALGSFKDNLADFLDLDSKISAFKDFFEGFLKFIFGTQDAYGAELPDGSGILPANFVKSWNDSLGTAETSASLFDKFLGVIDGMRFNILSLIKKVRGADIMAIAISGSMLKFANDIGGIGESLKNALDSLGSYLRSIKKRETNTDKLQKVVKSMIALIVVIVASIFILTQIDPDRMMTAAGVLTGIIVVASALVGALMIIDSKIGSVKDGASIATAFLGLAGSILLIVAALKLLAEIEIDDTFNYKLMILGIAFGAMAGLVMILGTIKADFSTLKNIVYITALAGAIFTVVAALKLLSMVPMEGMGERLAIVAGIFVALSALIIILGKIKLNPRVLSSLASISALAQALLLVVVALAILSFMSMDGIDQRLEVLARVLIMFAGIIIIIGRAQIDPKAIANLTALKSMAFALLIVVGAIALLSLMDQEGIDKALNAIGRIIIMFMGLIAVTKIAGNLKGAGTMLLAASISILILVGAIALLNNMDQDATVRSLVIIGALTAFMMGLMAVSKFTKGATLSLVAISIVLWSMAGVLGILSSLNPTSAMAATIALSTLLGSLTICLAVLSKIKATSPKDILAAAGSLAILSLALIPLGAVIAVISGFDISSNIAGPMAVIVGALTALTGIYAALAHFGIIINLAGGPVAMIGIASSFAVAADAMIIIVGALIAMIGVLDELSNGEIVNTINRGAEVLTTIGSAIGGLIGGIIGGIAGGVASAFTALMSIGQSLSGFMVSLTPFIDGLKTINPEIVQLVGYLADAILKITASSLIDSITSFITGGKDISKFGEQVGQLCNSIAEASSSITELSEDDVKKFENFSRIITPFTDIMHNMEGSGGLVQAIFGEKDLGGFGESIAKMCEEMKKAVDATEGMNMDEIGPKFEKLKNTIQPFIDLAKELPGTEGILQWFMGKQDLGDFGTTLANLCKSIGKGVDALKGYNIEGAASKFETLKSIVKPFIEMSSELQAHDGALQWWTGDNKFSDFGEELETLAACFVSAKYKLDEVSDINSIWNVINMLKDFIWMSNQIVSEQANVVNLSTLLRNVSDAIAVFCDNLAENTNIEDVKNKVKDLLEGIIEALNIDDSVDLSRIEYVVETVKTSINNLKDAIVGLQNDTTASNAMKNFMDHIITALNGKKEELKSNAESIKNEVVAIMESLPDGGELSSLANKVTTTLGVIRRNSQKALDKAKPIFLKAGKQFLNELEKGLRDSFKLQGIYNAGVAAANKAYSGAVTCVTKFNTIGRNCLQGVINGANGKMPEVYKAFYKAGEKALHGFQDATEQASPSKAFARASHYNILGIVKGAVQYAHEAEQAYYDLGKDSINAAQAGFLSTSLMPVIDFDTTQIEELQGISSGNFNIGADVNTRFLNGSIDSLATVLRKQTNQDVVDAITGLRDIIRDSVGDTYFNGDLSNDSVVTNAINTITHRMTVEGRI